MIAPPAKTYHKFVKTTPKPRATKNRRGELVGPVLFPPPPPPLEVGGPGGDGDAKEGVREVAMGVGVGEAVVKVMAVAAAVLASRGRRIRVSPPAKRAAMMANKSMMSMARSSLRAMERC